MLTIEPSVYALLPAFVAMFLAFLTQRVVVALSCSILVGGIVLAALSGEWSGLNIVEHFLMPALMTKSFATIVVIYCLCLGTIIGMWNKTDGAQHFAEVLGGKIAKGPRSSLLFTWTIGLIFHQGGTISTVLAGTTAKPIADKHRISHEELAYVVDSTASPIATIIPFNAWPLYVAGVVAGTVPILPDMDSAYHFYLHSIAYNFYAIFAVTMTGLFACGYMPWMGARMRRAQVRARTTGQLDHPKARPMIVTSDAHLLLADGYKVCLADFLLPVGVLLGMTVLPFVGWKLGFVPEKYANWIKEAFVFSACSSVILAKARGMSWIDICRGVYQGAHSMAFGTFIIGLAITVGMVTRHLGAADYLISLAESSLPIWSLPGILTVLCMIVAFATGTSLGTYAVVYPIALPLAYTLSTDPQYMLICFGAILGGTVFGDQCSPISDTTILSSMFTGCDLMEHVRTQLPLAVLAAFLACCTSTALMWVYGFN